MVKASMVSASMGLNIYRFYGKDTYGNSICGNDTQQRSTLAQRSVPIRTIRDLFHGVDPFDDRRLVRNEASWENM